MICPKCNFSQPDDYYCAQCGVNVEKYIQKQRKKRLNFGLIITVLAIAALSIVLFMSIPEEPKKIRHPRGYLKRDKSGPKITLSRQATGTKCSLQSPEIQ
jgi:hypothetical protein